MNRASVWTGTAASWVDLHAFLPPGFIRSEATGIASDGVNYIVSGWGVNAQANRDEALLWTMPIPPPLCPADFNGDKAVNTADLVFCLGRFGQTVTPNSNGDLNGDGLVNTADLVAFLGRFGRACP